jgi:hypothetical protein
MDKSIKIDCGTFTIDGKSHFHVKKIEAFTGGDDYEETDCVEITTESRNRLKLARVVEHSKKSSYRSRYEPAVRLFLACEEIDSAETVSYVLTISHHKGSLCIDAEKLGE